MELPELLSFCRQIMTGFSRVLGPDTEIVLHDLEKRELVHIINGDITGRGVGYKMDPSVYDTLLGLANEDGCLVGYTSHSKEGTKLRSSHIVLKDPSGTPVALICINQDTSKWEAVRNLIDSMISSQPLSTHDEISESSENYIQNVTRQVIMDAIQQSKPSNLETKEAKLSVLRELEIKGVFSVKDAVPIVCKTLAVSQATLYNYLRELRSQEAFK